jgi:hypothetical protein
MHIPHQACLTTGPPCLFRITKGFAGSQTLLPIICDHRFFCHPSLLLDPLASLSRSQTPVLDILQSSQRPRPILWACWLVSAKPLAEIFLKVVTRDSNHALQIPKLVNRPLYLLTGSGGASFDDFKKHSVCKEGMQIKRASTQWGRQGEATDEKHLLEVLCCELGLNEVDGPRVKEGFPLSEGVHDALVMVQSYQLLIKGSRPTCECSACPNMIAGVLRLQQRES